MGIEDIQISEELQTNAPSIKYSGNEGPKSPQQMQEMMMAQIEEEYSKYLDDMIEQGLDPMSFEQFLDQVMAEGQMSGGTPLPNDPTKPVNPFQPKPTGPVLPDRQMAAYGGIMGADGRKQYGIGSWFQKAKDKVVDDLIPNEIKENPLLTAAIVAGGDQLLTGGQGRRTILEQLGKAKDYVIDKSKPITDQLGKITSIETGKDRTLGGDILGSISKNIVPIVGGIGAGLFTKKTNADNPGLPSDDTALNLAEYKKAANLLNQKQGLAADMNFLPSVSARKYSPEEMAITYAQAANGGRIGYENGGDPLSEFEVYRLGQMGYDVASKGVEPFGGLNVLRDILKVNSFAMGGRIGMAEGGIMDLGGMEKDYRAEGGFVPIGREEKADDVPARLSVNEFVFTADAVRNAGGGDIDKGAQVMENMMRHLEQGGQVSEESQGMAGARDMFATSQRLGEVI
jgi:hypothetical protein